MSNFNYTTQTTLNNTTTLNTSPTRSLSPRASPTLTSPTYVTSDFPTRQPRAALNPQACAACKHQRRKCMLDCLLAPYFPATATASFLNAHKLFGVKKITKTLQSLPDPTQRALAARSIIAHANARAADPAGGCLRVIMDIGRQIEACTAELAIVNNHLGVCRAQEHVFVDNNVGSYDDVAGEEHMIMSLLEEDNKGSVFGLRNKFEVKEDAEVEHQGGYDEETEQKVSASLNFSSLSGFVHKVEVES